MYGYQQLPPDPTLTVTSSINQAKKSSESRLRLVHQKKKYTVPPKSFLELAKLDYLELDLSYGKALDFQATFDLLAQLPNLKVLSLIKCHAGSISPNISKLKNLEKLILWNNDLTELPDEFSELENLKELNLRTNKFKEIPPQIFALENLEKLIFCSNRIGNLPDELFDLKKLTFLDVESCGLKEIPSKIEQLIQLETLKFGRNKISKIPDSLLKMKSLKKVEAVGNKKMDLLSFFRLLKKNGQDKEVDLSKTKLTEFPEDLLFLTELETLNLSNNQLSELPDFLPKFKHLKTIHLGNNQFEKFPEVLAKMPWLKEVHLPNNQLKSLPDAIGNLVNLVNFSIANNQIPELPDALKKLKKLENFNYWGNTELTREKVNKAWKGRLYHSGIRVDSIQKLENYAEEYDNIEKADFWDIGMYDISEDLGKLINLKHLGFKNTRAPNEQISYKLGKGMISLPESAKNLKYLETINTYGCTKIENFAWLFQSPENLKELNTSDLPLHEYLEYIYECRNLQQLHLKLENVSLSDKIANLKQLEKMSIRGTELAVLPAAFSDLPNLKMLNINVDSADWDAIMPVIGSIKSLENLYIVSKIGAPEDFSVLQNLPKLQGFGLSIFDSAKDDYETILQSIAQIQNQPILNFYFKTDTIPAAVTLFSDYPKEKFDFSINDGKNWKPSLDLAIATQRLPSIKRNWGKNLELTNQINAFIQQYKDEKLPELTKKLLFAAHLKQLNLVEKELSNLKQDVDLTQPQSVFISGKVTGLTKKKIEELLKAKGHQLSKKLNEETTFSVLTLTTKSDLLIEMIEQKIPLWLEDDFKGWLWKMDTPYIMESGAEELTEQVKRLLFSEDDTNLELALELVAGGGATPEITTYLLAVMLFHYDKEIRKKARQSFRIYASADLQMFIKQYWTSSSRSQKVNSFMGHVCSRKDIEAVSFFLMVDFVLKKKDASNLGHYRISNGLALYFPFIKMPDTILLRKDLKKLSFSNQKELDIPHLLTVLRKMPDLEEVEFTNTNINEVSEEFLALKKLKKLKFKGKQIQQLFGGKTAEELGDIFENLEHLELTFSESINDLNGFLDGTLFPKLKTLELINIPISICKNLDSLTELETLSINRSDMREVPKELFQLKKLKKINLESNQIKILPEELLSLPDLSELNVKNNQIEVFPITYFRGKDFFKEKLKLDIGFNKLKDFPMNLFEFERQYGWEVKMSNNKITTVPETLPDLFKSDSSYNIGTYRLQIGTVNGEIVALNRDWQNIYTKINFYLNYEY